MQTFFRCRIVSILFITDSKRNCPERMEHTAVSERNCFVRKEHCPVSERNCFAQMEHRPES